MREVAPWGGNENLAMNTSAQAAEQVVLEAFAAVNTRDNDRLARVCHPDATFLWPDSLRPSAFGAGSWDELWEPFQPPEAFPTRGMDPQVVACGGDRVAVRWHQRGVNSRGDRADFEVLGLYEVRDNLLYRAQMFYFDAVAVRRFLTSNDA